MVRGGSWNNKPENVRASFRNWNEPGNRNNNIGFRCVRDVGRKHGFRAGGSPVKAGERVLSSHPGRAPDAGTFSASNINRVLVL